MIKGVDFSTLGLGRVNVTGELSPDTISLYLSASSLSFEAGGGTNAVTAYCNGNGGDLIVEVEGGQKQWLTTSVNNRTVNFVVSENQTTGTRSAIVNITFGGITKTVTVNQ